MARKRQRPKSKMKPDYIRIHRHWVSASKPSLGLFEAVLRVERVSIRALVTQTGALGAAPRWVAALRKRASGLG